jgi:DNA-directed RNA polymerase subunit RPC12/RpoP
MTVVREFVCALCGGTFESERPDEEAWAEAEELWGKDAGPMEIVCEHCFEEMTHAAD